MPSAHCCPATCRRSNGLHPQRTFAVTKFYHIGCRHQASQLDRRPHYELLPFTQMTSYQTNELFRTLTNALAEVAAIPDLHAEKKWILTIAAFAVSGAALLTSLCVTLIGYIVSNRCWNMFSAATKVMCKSCSLLTVVGQTHPRSGQFWRTAENRTNLTSFAGTSQSVAGGA